MKSSKGKKTEFNIPTTIVYVVPLPVGSYVREEHEINKMNEKEENTQ